MFTFFLYPLSHCVQTSLGKAMGYIWYHSLFSIFMPYLKSFPLRCCCLSALSSFSLRFTPVLWNQRRLCHWKGELGPQGVAWSKQWCELNTLIPICPTVGDISTLWSVLSNGGGNSHLRPFHYLFKVILCPLKRISRFKTVNFSSLLTKYHLYHSHTTPQEPMWWQRWWCYYL